MTGPGGGGASEPEWLDTGPRGPNRPCRGRRSLLALLGVALFALVTVHAVRHTGSDGRDGDRPGAAAVRTPAASEPGLLPATGPAERLPSRPVVVATGRGPLLPGVRSGALYLRTTTAVYRADLGSGRLTRTAVREFGVYGPADPMLFLAGPHGVVIDPPASAEDGIYLPDDGPPKTLAAALNEAPALYPAPHGDLWVAQARAGNDVTWLVRMSFDGTRASDAALVAPQRDLEPDGAGGLLVPEAAGVYATTTSGLRRVASGVLLAASRRAVLVEDCDPGQGCFLDLVDRYSGKLRRLEPVTRDNLPEAVLSPDGRQVALADWDGTSSRARVLDLRTLASRTVPGSLDGELDAREAMLWTADSRWLLCLLDGRLQAFDSSTGALRTLPLPITAIKQIALRGSLAGG